MAKSTHYVAKTPDSNGVIHYSQEEQDIWRDLYQRQLPSTQKYAAQACLNGMEMLSLPDNRIPQCDEISQVLMPLTGWRVEPVPALIGFGRFFKIRLYWFTIEFGLSREQGQYRALGSGLNSSPTELVYAVESSAPERREFHVIDILRTPYRIDIHQPIYYVIEDINDLFKAADRNLLADIKQAQSLGLFEPAYDCQLTG